MTSENQDNKLDAMLRYRRIEPARADLVQRIILRAQSNTTNSDNPTFGAEDAEYFPSKSHQREGKPMKRIMIGTVAILLSAAGPAFPSSSTEFSDSRLRAKIVEQWVFHYSTLELRPSQ
jgi:hypothetical protein